MTSPVVSAPASRELTVSPHDGGTAAWDGYVERTEDSTFCHLLGWRDVLSDVLGAECTYLAAHDGDGGLRGVLPLVRVRSRLFGDYLVSVPFLNYGGPIGSPTARRMLADEAHARAARSGCDLLELRTREPIGRPSALHVTHRKITVVLPLPASTEHLWTETFRAKLRSQIRRPMRAGMEARFGPQYVGAFYEVFARHMRDLGTPVLPREFFERIATTFADHVTFGVVVRGERPVAAGCGFEWNGEFEMTWASALRARRREAPNMLLYWSFMARAIERGLHTFNFGRCTKGGGTHRFKRQWGGRDVALPWLQWSPRGRVATPSPEGLLYRTATAGWRRLPLLLANRAGPLLARKLP